MPNDLLSSFKAIKIRKIPTDITKHIQEKTYRANEEGKLILFIWIPELIGIPRNEKANQEALKATSPFHQLFI